jgi:hypothetical protein
MFYGNFFTGHWQPLHEAANIPVYGTTYYQAGHFTPPVYAIEITLESEARPRQRLRVSTESYQRTRYE